jgi:hypothetical protein
MAINEIALTCTSLMSAFPDTSFEIIEGLYTCVQCIKAWCDIFFTKLPSGITEFSTAIFHQLSGCVFALYRLYLINEPTFDTQYVRKTVNFGLIIDRLIDGLQDAKDMTVEWTPEQDAFTKTIRALTFIKNVASSRLLEVESSQSTELTDHSHAQGGCVEMEETFPDLGSWSDIENEMWLKDILGTW